MRLKRCCTWKCKFPNLFLILVQVFIHSGRSGVILYLRNTLSSLHAFLLTVLKIKNSEKETLRNSCWPNEQKQWWYSETTLVVITFVFRKCLSPEKITVLYKHIFCLLSLVIEKLGPFLLMCVNVWLFLISILAVSICHALTAMNSSTGAVSRNCNDFHLSRSYFLWSPSSPFWQIFFAFVDGW